MKYGTSLTLAFDRHFFALSLLLSNSEKEFANVGIARKLAIFSTLKAGAIFISRCDCEHEYAASQKKDIKARNSEIAWRNSTALFFEGKNKSET